MLFQTITLINAQTIDAAGDLTAEYTLASGEAKVLAQAIARGNATIRSFCASAKTGSPVVTLDSIKWSIDGTNFANLHNFTDVDITPTGEHVVGQITTKTFPSTATKLLLGVTVTTLDGSNKLNGYTCSIDCVF